MLSRVVSEVLSEAFSLCAISTLETVHSGRRIRTALLDSSTPHNLSGTPVSQSSCLQQRRHSSTVHSHHQYGKLMR